MISTHSPIDLKLQAIDWQTTIVTTTTCWANFGGSHRSGGFCYGLLFFGDGNLSTSLSLSLYLLYLYHIVYIYIYIKACTYVYTYTVYVYTLHSTHITPTYICLYTHIQCMFRQFRHIDCGCDLPLIFPVVDLPVLVDF